MKILHTADLHLDSAFCSDSLSDASARRERQREVLKKIFRCALENECDMILIAGDLFDTAFITPETTELCLSLLSDFKKPIVIAPGNHDPYIDGSFYKSAHLSENVFVFTAPELQYFDIPALGVTVGGWAFTSSAMTKNPLEEQAVQRQNENIMILCAHADLDSPTSRYAPVLTSDIFRHGFDYAALGHIHNPKDGDGNIRYCGFPEGRSFDEQGEGGVLIVTIEAGESPHIEKVVISELEYVTRELSVDGMSDGGEIANTIVSEIKRISSHGRTALRIRLTGVISSDMLPDLRAIESAEWENVVSLTLYDDTLRLPDRSFLEKDTSLRGEFYRTLKGKLMSDDTDERRLALRALRIGLAAIDGKDFTQGGRA